MNNKTKAIIDLGTNTFHLMIVEITVDSAKVVHRERLPVKIGEGGISRGFIAIKPYERALKSLINFKETIDKYQVEEVRAIATSAIRNAENGQQFVQEVEEKTGIKINVISGEEEAELIYKGVSQATDIQDNSIIVDIGGGSVEFIICDKEKVNWVGSYEIGGQRLVDKFHTEDPISKLSMSNLDDFLTGKLDDVVEAITKYNPKTLIGSSGTFDTLCEMYYAKENKNMSLDDDTAHKLPLSAFFSLSDELKQKNRDERLKMPGMIEMRVDMIVVACCLIEYVINKSRIKTIEVSTYALKEGVMEELQSSMAEE